MNENLEIELTVIHPIGLKVNVAVSLNRAAKKPHKLLYGIHRGLYPRGKAKGHQG
ncbi:MAG: hypothetical protein HC895_14710 [Leptolyngbyaceae cyanobacterium SM1_3_5]|nr:hypothetical protein [Leptolyngbyaceae cyanobacterium SM1_3_5]